MKDRKSNQFIVLKTLEEETDENHFIGQSDLVSLLERKDIYFDRKTVISHLESLRSASLDGKGLLNGIVVSKGDGSPRHKKGSYGVSKRLFSTEDIEIIYNAIDAFNSISKDKVEEIKEKLNTLLSKYQYEELLEYNEIVKTSDIHKEDSSELNNNIKKIKHAIKHKKQISFLYYSYDDKGKLVIKHKESRNTTNPYYLIIKAGKYYLLGYKPNAEDLTCYRLDFLGDVVIEDQLRQEISYIPKYSKGFNIDDYIQNHIYFGNGETIRGQVILDGSISIRAVFDWFGDKAKITSKNGYLMAEIVSEENAFFYWCMQYMEHVFVVSPQSIIDRVKRCTERVIEVGKNNLETSNSETLENILNKKGPIIITRRDYSMSDIELNDFYRSIRDVSHLKRVNMLNLNFKRFFYKKGMTNGRGFCLCDGLRRVLSFLILLKNIVDVVEKYNINGLSNGYEDQTLEDIKSIYFEDKIDVLKINKPSGKELCLSINSVYKDKDFLNNESFKNADLTFNKFVNDLYLSEDGGVKAIRNLYKQLVGSTVFSSTEEKD